MRYLNIPTFDMLPCDSERPESVKAEKDDFSTILAFESSITSENPGHFFWKFAKRRSIVSLA